MLHQVTIADMRVSEDVEDVLVTYSLGSCVALSLYDPTLHLAGLVHCMLPMSTVDSTRAASTPAMFVDSGVSALLQTMFNMGAQRTRLVAKIAGGASILDERGFFRIGERNLTILRKLLWKNGILISGDDTGGSIARSMYVYVADGRTEIRANGHRFDL